MRYLRAYWPYLSAVLALAFIAAVSLGVVPAPEGKPAGSVVKIIEGKSHGSGVHIGNGFVLTAAHVVGKSKTADLKLDDGTTRKAEVLWTNKGYDIALIRTSSAGMAASVLACRSPNDGETITARGNPTILEFVDSYGRVAGNAREVGPWGSVIITDITTVPGMSGGGVFDASGHLIAITVGVMSAPAGMFPSLSGFGTAVPGSTICSLMGRVA